MSTRSLGNIFRLSLMCVLLVNECQKYELNKMNIRFSENTALKIIFIIIFWYNTLV